MFGNPVDLVIRNPLQKAVDEIVNEFPNQLAAAKHFAKRRCSSCRGEGFVSALKRAGATDAEARTALVCGCAKKRIIREAEKRKAGGNEVLRHEGTNERS